VAPGQTQTDYQRPRCSRLHPHDEAYFETSRGRRTPKQLQTLHKGKHETIIPETLWRRAQEIKRTNTSPNLAKE
jgi:Recombinase